jgi:purine nucleosidase
MPRTFLIDTDAGSDDAVAIIMALRTPDIRVAAITVVAGNIPLQQGISNVLYTAELCASDVPILAGATHPLKRPLCCADWFHGEDGLGDHGYKPKTRTAEKTHAVDAMIETIRANPGLTIVTLGPLTNVALALQRDPTLAASVGRCVIMGGNPCCEGNITPAAEFNIYVDPEAARIVFHSGMNIEMVGWHLCRGAAALNRQEIDSLLASKNPLAEFAVHSNSIAAESYHTQTGEYGICLPDPTAMGIAIDPALCLDGTSHYVEIETASELNRGLTLVDKLNVAHDRRNIDIWAPTIAAQPRKIHICWTMNIPAWKKSLFMLLTE